MAGKNMANPSSLDRQQAGYGTIQAVSAAINELLPVFRTLCQTHSPAVIWLKPLASMPPVVVKKLQL